MNTTKNRPIFITMGDPAGIGPEIILKSFQNAEIARLPGLIVVGSLSILRQTSQNLPFKPKTIPIQKVEDAFGSSEAIYVWDIDNGEGQTCKPGFVDGKTGMAAYRYLEEAAKQSKLYENSGIVTAPIHKGAIHAAGISFPGHTEILQALCGVDKVLTMFVVRQLRVFFYTRHLSLRDAIQSLDIEKICRTLCLMAFHLRQIGFPKPNLALAALNPHASDGGMFGNEEAEILLPAVMEAQKQGIQVQGPIPADSVFHQASIGKYDAVLSLYHDQGHIACKTYDFERTVSVTLGLPFIRTSVDHGTALDIAGKDIASSISMEEAILHCHKLGQIVKENTKYR